MLTLNRTIQGINSFDPAKVIYPGNKTGCPSEIKDLALPPENQMGFTIVKIKE